MSSANEYRAQGESYLSRAAESTDPEIAKLFRELAADYFALAADGGNSQPAMQQQQQIPPVAQAKSDGRGTRELSRIVGSILISAWTTPACRRPGFSLF
jgi:hypothetical protein